MHAVTFHAVDTQMKSMHKQGFGERSEPHSLYIIIQETSVYVYVCVYVCVLIVCVFDDLYQYITNPRLQSKQQLHLAIVYIQYESSLKQTHKPYI